MRKGRGLVDMDIYDELMKVPGARELLFRNTTNHRLDRKTGKNRAEIHEDAWPEVKEMVRKWKIYKKEEEDKKKGKKPKKSSRVKKHTSKRRVNKKPTPQPKLDKKVSDKTEKMRRLKAGDKIFYKNSGFGLVSYEGPDVVYKRKKNKLFTGTFDSSPMEWDGTTWKFDGGVGLVVYAVLENDVPERALEE